MIVLCVWQIITILIFHNRFIHDATLKEDLKKHWTLPLRKNQGVPIPTPWRTYNDMLNIKWTHFCQCLPTHPHSPTHPLPSLHVMDGGYKCTFVALSLPTDNQNNVLCAGYSNVTKVFLGTWGNSGKWKIKWIEFHCNLTMENYQNILYLATKVSN